MDTFFVIEAVGKGSWLGLSMVKGFLEQSNGVLEPETMLGVGTTVRLFSPVLDEEGKEDVLF